MKAYLMINPLRADAKRLLVWTHERARQLVGSGDYDDFLIVDVDPLMNMVAEYFKFRGYQFPTEDQAFKFLVSEVGEFADVSVSMESEEWVRNNPQNKSSSLEKLNDERGDVLMMLIATGFERGVDALECMIAKFQKKGYRQ